VPFINAGSKEAVKKPNRAIVIGFGIFATVIIGVAISIRSVPALIIKDNSGAIIARLPLYDSSFVHHYVHSVHKTPVDEYFEVQRNTLELVKVKYDTYGVGMPSDGGEGFSIENGRFVVAIHRAFSSIPIRVSIVPDHGVIIEGTLFPFTQWVPKESAITLSAGRMLIFRHRRISPK